MKTLNVVSGSGIQGNVGSCTTNSVEVTTSAGIFGSDGYYVLTNSCNGTVQTAPFTQWNGPGVIFGGFAFCIFIFMLGLAALAF